MDGLGDAEVDDLDGGAQGYVVQCVARGLRRVGWRVGVVGDDKDVARLEVAVNDPLLMGVLNRVADLHEHEQSIAK